MTENNAAQPGLTDDEILDAIKAGIRAARDEGLAYAGPDNYVVAGAHALLSKLRAEGVRAGEAVQWPIMPPSKGQSSVLFDDGYAEGWAKCLDECRRAALASAPVAGDAQHDTDSVCAWQVWWNQHKNRYTTTRQASLAAFAAGKEWRDAAPQASEAVRILFPTHLRKMWSGGEVQAWLDEHQGITPPKVSAKGSMERYRKWQAEQPQADKDGGDCAKGAGENLLDYAMAIAHERELDVLGHKHNSDEAVDRFKAAVERALSPTPSVVKQSLTATQTGEKGESDAN